MSSVQASDHDVQEVAEQLQLTHIDLDSHWEGFWEAAFGGDRE